MRLTTLYMVSSQTTTSITLQIIGLIFFCTGMHHEYFFRSSMCFRVPHLCSKIPKIYNWSMDSGDAIQIWFWFFACTWQQWRKTSDQSTKQCYCSLLVILMVNLPNSMMSSLVSGKAPGRNVCIDTECRSKKKYKAYLSWTWCICLLVEHVNASCNGDYGGYHSECNVGINILADSLIECHVTKSLIASIAVLNDEKKLIPQIQKS